MPDDIDPTEPEPRVRPDGDGPPDPRTEQAVRSAMRARAASVTPTSLHRPTYPERRTSRVRPMLLTAAAVIAVGGLVIGITLATHHSADQATAPLNPTVTASAESSRTDSTQPVSPTTNPTSTVSTAPVNRPPGPISASAIGTHWILDEVSGPKGNATVKPSIDASLELRSNGVAALSDGINDMNGRYELTGGQLSFPGGVTSTEAGYAGTDKGQLAAVTAVQAIVSKNRFTLSVSGTVMTLTGKGFLLTFHNGDPLGSLNADAPTSTPTTQKQSSAGAAGLSVDLSSTTASQPGLAQVEGIHWILDSFTTGGRTTDTRAFPAASFEINSNLIGWDYTCGGGTFHYSAVGTTVRIGASAGMPPHTCSQVPPGQGPKAVSALFDATTFTASASGATLTVTSPAQTLTFHKDGAARLYWANH